MASSILLLDAETHIRHILSYKLRSLGFVVHSVASADDAARTLRDSPVDLIVMDVELDEHDSAFELGDRLRNDVPTAELPIIILSGRQSEADIRRSHEISAAGYVTKPFSINFLIRKIRAILPEHSSQQ